MPESSPKAFPTYGFPVDGRTPHEVHEMKEYGYGEDSDFMRSRIRDDGYFCSTCRFWEHVPNIMPRNPTPQDGVCRRWNFRDRAYGCCASWTKR